MERKCLSLVKNLPLHILRKLKGTVSNFIAFPQSCINFKKIGFIQLCIKTVVYADRY